MTLHLLSPKSIYLCTKYWKPSFDIDQRSLTLWDDECDDDLSIILCSTHNYYSTRAGNYPSLLWYSLVQSSWIGYHCLLRTLSSVLRLSLGKSPWQGPKVESMATVDCIANTDTCINTSYSSLKLTGSDTPYSVQYQRWTSHAYAPTNSKITLAGDISYLKARVRTPRRATSSRRRASSFVSCNWSYMH